MRLRLTVVLTIAVALVFSLVSTPTQAAAQAKVEKLVFASAGFEDTNRFWMVARPDHLQFDPFLETLLEVDPKTGAYAPRLAEKWEASADFRRWTFWLRKGVQFHYGYGPFTAKDVAHSYALTQRPEAKMTLGPFWRGVEEVKVVNDYQVVFYMKKPATTMDYAVSRAGDFRIVSKAQWDKEGLEGFDKRPAGTGSYRYVGRQQGISITFERQDNHWRDKPAFKQLEFRIVREEPTRLAMLLSSEAHIADLPRELQKEAGYGPGKPLKFKVVAFTEPGESEGPQVAEALGIYYREIGIETEIEVLDWAKVREMFRKKATGCCIWPNIISWRPSEEWIRTSYWSKSAGHNYENEFIDKTYNALTQAVKPEERQRLARAIGDHLFEEIADIPLFWFRNEVVANPKVV